MDLLELVKAARSVRRFVEAETIPLAVLRELVDLVRLVPSAGNQQPLRYRLVTDAAERRGVFAHLKWAGQLKDWDGPAEGERPAGYVIILSPLDKNPAVDVGIAAQTLQLAARERGLGACMLGAIDRTGIHKTLGLPADLQVQLVVALGMPAETVVLEETATGGSTAYWRSSDQVHHVPKRRLEDVIV